jgi:hypothetical protein
MNHDQTAISAGSNKCGAQWNEFLDITPANTYGIIRLAPPDRLLLHNNLERDGAIKGRIGFGRTDGIAMLSVQREKCSPRTDNYA